MAPSNDTLETACLSLTFIYYAFHLRTEWKHALRRARIRLSRPAFRSWQLVFGTLFVLFLSGCVQSGPALFYLSHLLEKL